MKKFEKVIQRQDPMLHPGWLEFNEERWGLSAERLLLTPSRGSSWRLETVIYTNKHGHLVMPPRNPYIPVEFYTPVKKLSAWNRQKRQAIAELSKIYADRKIKGTICLDAQIDDPRPFQWRDMVAVPRFTYHISLPNWKECVDRSVLNKSNKAKNAGYTCIITKDFEAAQSCLIDAERRKSFDHKVGTKSLYRLSQLMGQENFVVFAIKNNEGFIKGAHIRLYTSGGNVLAWSAGIKTEALKDGANNLLVEYVLSFFEKQHCQIFDFGGANIPPVAKMKEAWGGRLVTYYAICQRNIRYLAKESFFTFQKMLSKARRY